MTSSIGLYFVGEAIADQRPDPENPRKMLVALGGSMYFGSMGAARAIQGMEPGRMKGGIKSFYVGPVSEDYFGGLIRDDFKSTGVDTAYTRSSPFISMIAVISEDGKGGNKYSFYGRNQMNTTEHLTLDQLPASFEEEKRIFTFGSVTTTLSPSGQTLKEFAKRQIKNGSIVLFDPNTRPSVIPDVAVYRTSLEDWIKTASVVKASEEDVQFTYPDKSLAEIAAYWLSLGVTAAFITQGEKGCTVYHKNGSSFVETVRNPLITKTVGAGDNFNAGIVVALAERDITMVSQLALLDKDGWKDVATAANDIAYQHLLRVNQAASDANPKAA